MCKGIVKIKKKEEGDKGGEGQTVGEAKERWDKRVPMHYLKNLYENLMYM